MITSAYEKASIVDVCAAPIALTYLKEQNQEILHLYSLDEIYDRFAKSIGFKNLDELQSVDSALVLKSEIDAFYESFGLSSSQVDELTAALMQPQVNVPILLQLHVLVDFDTVGVHSQPYLYPDSSFYTEFDEELFFLNSGYNGYIVNHEDWLEFIDRVEKVMKNNEDTINSLEQDKAARTEFVSDLISRLWGDVEQSPYDIPEFRPTIESSLTEAQIRRYVCDNHEPGTSVSALYEYAKIACDNAQGHLTKSSKIEAV
ncbi:hypothetical protein BCU09_21665 [Vibrio cyclitrophicus]|uniref:hypothetical protein n=1 Tax=Vibrio cyclitrophicus TaxID=47951 RepID=UPI000C83BB8D|nr:hypothetical protein [Vibrio cyclitrophicus]PMJ99077.1 hypothetical protein BCU09_21665 [Vibrio cyclitrophicus]